MANKEIKVQLTSPERYFSKCYHDFMDCNLLNGEEKITFLALKRFLDVKSDSGNVFPAIETIQEMTNWGNQKVIKYINSLVKKGVVKKIRQGLSKPNLYTIADYDGLWQAQNLDKLKEMAQETELERAARILREAGYTVSKEKEPTSIPTTVTDVSTQYQTDIPIYTTKTPESQVLEVPEDLERYTMDDIRQIFNYDIMIHDHPYQQQDIDSVMDILYTALNTTNPTIRIAKEDKPTMVVISKLRKLNNESILYCIKKFSEQTERIKNPNSYMLTLLYTAPEQFYLDIKNRVSHDMAHWNALKLNTAGNGFRPLVGDNIPESQFYQSDNVFSKEVD